MTHAACRASSVRLILMNFQSLSGELSEIVRNSETWLHQIGNADATFHPAPEPVASSTVKFVIVVLVVCA